jgi:hypothetical protein
VNKSRGSRGQRSGSSIDEEKRTELLSQLYALTWSADMEKSVQAQREIKVLCSQHPFIARERARMVRELQWTRVVLARRARRGEPLYPPR